MQSEECMSLLVSAGPVSKPVTSEKSRIRKFQGSVYNRELSEWGKGKMANLILLETGFI